MNIESYIAGDGGGKLHINDVATLEGQDTTANQNPILYLAYMARAYGLSPSLTVAAVYHGQMCWVGRGRYLRRLGDPLRQSHDNVLAWAWWSTQIDFNWARHIYDFAKWRFFIYDPHHRFSLDVRCLLQPSHVFTLGLAAGLRPGYITSIWFAMSCALGDHSADYYLKSMLRSDIVRARLHLLSKRKQRIVLWGLELMEKRREKLSRWYKEYYRDDPNHPAVLAQVEKDK